MVHVLGEWWWEVPLSGVFSLFFTRYNSSSMTAKFISWILHTALCIVLLATNSGSAVLLLAHVLQEVFELASQTKWEEEVQGQSFYTRNTESRLNVKGRTSDISSKHFSSSLTELQSSLSQEENVKKTCWYFCSTEFSTSIQSEKKKTPKKYSQQGLNVQLVKLAEKSYLVPRRAVRPQTWEL